MQSVYIQRSKFDIRVEHDGQNYRGFLLLDDGELPVLLYDHEIVLANQLLNTPEPPKGTGDQNP